MPIMQELNCYIAMFMIYGTTFKKQGNITLGYVLQISYCVMISLLLIGSLSLAIIDLIHWDSVIQMNIKIVMLTNDLVWSLLRYLSLMYLSIRGSFHEKRFLPESTLRNKDHPETSCETSYKTGHREYCKSVANSAKSKLGNGCQIEPGPGVSYSLDEFNNIGKNPRDVVCRVDEHPIISYANVMMPTPSRYHRIMMRLSIALCVMFFSVTIVGISTLSYYDKCTEKNDKYTCIEFYLVLCKFFMGPVDFAVIFYLSSYMYELSQMFERLYRSMKRDHRQSENFLQR